MNDSQLLKRSEIGDYVIITIVEAGPQTTDTVVYDSKNARIFYESQKWDIDDSPEEYELIEKEMLKLHEKLAKLIEIIVGSKGNKP